MSVFGVRPSVVSLLTLAGCANVQSVGPMTADYETCTDPAWGRAQAALARKDPPAARAELLTTLRACPNFVPAHLALIESARAADGSVDRAVVQFYEDYDWRAPSPIQGLVRARLARNDKERLEALEASLAVDGSFYFASLDLAEVWSRNDRLSNSLAAYESAVQAKPGSWRANLGLARALHQIGRAEDASPAFGRALATMPEDAPERRDASREYLRLLLYELRQAGPAAPIADAMLEHTPNDVPLLMDRAGVHWLVGDRDRAAALYRRVLELEPREFRAALCLGNLFFDRPQRSEDAKRRDWPRARLAYLYFLDHVDDVGAGDGFDLADRYVSVPCRLRLIDEAIGALPADSARPRLGDF